MKSASATSTRDARWPGLFPAAILAAVLFNAAFVLAAHQQPQTLAELEAACEEEGFGEEQCLGRTGCCVWDDGQCWAGDLEDCELQLDFPIVTIDEEEDAEADNVDNDDRNDEVDYANADGMMSLEELESLCEDPSLNEAACRRMPCCFYEEGRCWAVDPGECGIGERGEDNGDEDNDGNGDNEDGDGGTDGSNSNAPVAAADGSSCLDEYAKRLGVEPVPETAPEQYRSSYCQYTFLEAPSGRRVEIFGQSQLSSLQMYRARALLSFYLEDVPGSQYGSNKKDVLEAMAANKAKLDMPNGEIVPPLLEPGCK